MHLQSQLLVLAVDYHQMFKGLLTKLPKLKGRFDHEIAWAKAHLKKNDRIVWYLRWVRLDTIRQQEDSGLLPAGTLDKELKALGAKAGKQYTKTGFNILRDDWRFKRDMEHYMSIEDQDMQSKRFGYETPLELMDELKVLDDAYKAKTQEDQRLLEPQEGDEPYIKFGNGWAWWALSRGYCTEEAKAMGHCGNQGQVTGDQILSLREPRKKGGKTYWEPNLTFILDKSTGLLGEMKGRGNEKPAARYHPYIITLLKDQRIKGIKGGGYKPSHNFSMNDLTEEDRSKLEEEKPELMTLESFIKKNKIDVNKLMRKGEVPAFLIEKTQAILGLPNTYSESEAGWVIKEWKDAQAFVDDKGDSSAQWLMEHDNGNEHLEIYETGWSNDDMINIIDSLKKPIVHNIGLTLEQEYPDELQDFITEQGGTEEFTWEPDHDEDVKDFLKFLEEDQGISTDVMDTIRLAYQYGAESGTMDRMSSTLTEAIKDATDSGERIHIAYEGGGIWDGKLFAMFNLSDAVVAAMEVEGSGDTDDDYYGQTFVETVLEDLTISPGNDNDYNDFDEKAVIEHLNGEFGAPPKSMKEPVEGQPELFPDVYEPAAVESEKPAFGTKGVTH